MISEVNREINNLRQSIPSAEDKDETEEEISEREKKERKEKEKDFEETGEYTTRPEVGRREYDYSEAGESWLEGESEEDRQRYLQSQQRAKDRKKAKEEEE